MSKLSSEYLSLFQMLDDRPLPLRVVLRKLKMESAKAFVVCLEGVLEQATVNAKRRIDHWKYRRSIHCADSPVVLKKHPPLLCCLSGVVSAALLGMFSGYAGNDNGKFCCDVLGENMN